ncbi:MAG TPA: TetR/AcrR family transcriptional regulator [Pyrinomonadaceae bacterium]|nr:TetR/AcrR family transcriptional regulator [Pyrinomonadaceae bacterium]
MSVLIYFYGCAHKLLCMPAQRKTRADKTPTAKRGKRAVAGRRAQTKQKIRDNIVKAALSLFQTRGFEATTTKAIARKAGIAEGTVFNYFKSKDDIALYFFEAEVDHAMKAVRDNTRLRKAPLEEKLFALVHSQLEYLAPYERFIGTALLHALKPHSPLGPFSHRAMELRHRYLRFVEELIEESFPKKQNPLGFLAPEVFWIYYLGALLYWLYDTSEGKQNTLAFLDRSLNFGVSMLKQGKR